MKTLALLQPWATMVAAGIKTIENRTDDTTHRGRVLIVASGKKIPDDFLNDIPVEWASCLWDEQVLGNVPLNDDMPLGVVVGYADLVDVTQGITRSVWDGQSSSAFKWHFENAHLFDKPIAGIKVQNGLYDVDIDEDNLPPAHKAPLQYPRLDKSTLVMPVRADVFDAVSQWQYFSLMFDEGQPYVEGLLANNRSWDMRPVRALRFESGGRTLVRKVKEAYVGGVVDAEGDMLKGYSLTGDEKEYMSFTFAF